jgi:ferric-dicitrate binding protein FerR (iron transport regulator)
VKTRKLEKWILLDQTGELSARKKRRLDREMEASANARRVRDDLNRLTNAMSSFDVEPSVWSAQRIHARLLNQERKPVFVPNWKPALALAAGLAVVAGLWTFRPETDSTAVFAASGASLEKIVWEDPLAEDLAELETMIVAISESPLDIMRCNRIRRRR